MKLENKTKIPEKLLCRIIREGYGNNCKICHSTSSKNGPFGLFGKMLCHNQLCINSKPKK